MADEKNLMASTWTRAAKVRRAFRAGRKRQNDAVFSIEEAILQARLLFIRIRAEMVPHAEDVSVGLVLMSMTEVDRVNVLPVPRDIKMLPSFSAEAEGIEKAQRAIPVALVVWLRDREANNREDVWEVPWLTGDRAGRARDHALVLFEESHGKKAQGAF